jgi:hypothetical protein
VPNPIPLGYNDVLGALMAWGQSGLKPNATVIKSYLPPVKDPQTGIAVLVPATTFASGSVEQGRGLINKLMSLPRAESNVPNYNLIELSNSWGDELPTINSLPSAAYAGSGVSDFNVNSDDPNGPQTFIGIRSVPGSELIEQSLITNNQSDYINGLTNSVSRTAILNGFAVRGPNSNQALAKNTTPDRAARDLFRGLPRIIDRVEDANTVFSTPILGYQPSENLTDEEALPSNTKSFIPQRYELRATGIPCAVPGVLNCVMTKYDTVNKTDIVNSYVNPRVGMYYVSDRDVRQADGTYADDGNSIRLLPIDPDAFDNPPLSIVEPEPGELFVGDILYGR